MVDYEWLVERRVNGSAHLTSALLVTYEVHAHYELNSIGHIVYITCLYVLSLQIKR